jgi:hypothetical protein
MYRKFQEAYPEGEAETILHKYQEVAQGEQEDTLAGQQQLFDWVCTGFRGSVCVPSTLCIPSSLVFS